MPDLKEVNSVEEVADWLGKTTKYVWAMIARKRLRASRPGRSYIITREAIQEMLANSANRKENDNATTR